MKFGNELDDKICMRGLNSPFFLLDRDDETPFSYFRALDHDLQRKYAIESKKNLFNVSLTYSKHLTTVLVFYYIIKMKLS